jgi:hypothetical protein
MPMNDPIDYERLSDGHRRLAWRVYETLKQFLDSLPDEKKIAAQYEDALDALDEEERRFAERIFAVDPKTLGFNGEFCGRERPEDLVAVPSVTLPLGEGTYETDTQFVPKPAYEGFKKMAAAMKEEIGSTIYVDSAYRGPGRQAYLFFYELVEHCDYSLRENARWIAMPGYSQHGDPVRTAIDVVNERGISGEGPGQKPEDFEREPEYRWLLENARRFNFELSYPRDNKDGVAFEPWHWRWAG